jgi:GxxExxY protein
MNSVEDIAHAVIQAAFEEHKILGPGLLETVYEEALCKELEIRDI